jgi:hypothetical protein
MFGVIKERRLRSAGHMAHMGDGRRVYRLLLGFPQIRDDWEDLSLGGIIILS